MFLFMLCSSNYQRWKEEMKYSDLCLNVDTVGTQLPLQASRWAQDMSEVTGQNKKSSLCLCVHSTLCTYPKFIRNMSARNAFFHHFTHWRLWLVFISFHFIWREDRNSYHNLHWVGLCGVFSLASWNVL